MLSSKERYGKIFVDKDVFDEIYNAAMEQRVQFVITWIDGHDLDNPRTYYLKFDSQKDFNKFSRIVTPIGITCWAL